MPHDAARLTSSESLTAMRPTITGLPGSKIREVANAALGRSDVLAFWFGESDETTPEAIRAAAAKSIADGETFYSHNLGLPELRQAVAAYASRLHGPIAAERIAITSSGVNALMIAMQLLVDTGDEVVAVVPLWPNLTAQPAILGGRVRRVSLHPREGAWRLDLAELIAAVTPATRVLLLNAPNNPTGWTLTRAEQQTLLDHCRRTGTWIVADEVYERLYFEGGAAAPSFLDIATADDRLVVTQSFSKSFLMTGWRLGWLVLPRGAEGDAAKLIEFNTSCAPVFVQRAGLAGMAMADDFVPGLVARLRSCRDRLVGGLQRLPGVSVASPPGGMYAFFRVEGRDDSLAFAKSLVAEQGLGLAPGAAFGAEGEGWLRWCFAAHDPARLDDGVHRLAQALGL
ncbi:MAG: pyridoxal phosphate-dependent aminotransferase [Burkholderiales bacterium]|nr:pyridoxal phosphate-dependent aminotransferase [Burkholderiales bacterium]MDE2396485.1 pyridoxal phosphate-dependent aminotransferase [Burkholderiales bacterium]MDE2453171.1 pyridoxal phosphate-dependent aminotransferase [Burkholderiales bacterium]